MTNRNIKRLTLATLTLMSLITGHADKADDNIYLRKADDAQHAILNGDYKKAESLLLDAMRMQPGNPTNVMLLSNLGMVRFYMGNDSLALQNLDDAHRMAPSSVTILMNRAKVKSASGKVEEALADYDTVCHLDSTVADAYFYRGMIRMSDRDLPAAYHDFEKLRNLDPDGLNTALALGTYYLEISQPADAIPYFTRLINNEKSPEYYSARAFCYVLTDKLGEAADDIAAGLEIDPDDGELYFCRALLNKKRYRPADSVSDAKRALELGISPRRVESLLH